MVAISAHKGGSEAAGPATYEAYKHALTSGAEYAEFDIRRTGDDVLVAYHDARAGQSGPLLADLGYGELCDRAGYPVPKVAELMELLAGRLSGHLDLKEAGYEQEVVALAQATFGAGNFVVTGLEDDSLRELKQRNPSIRTGLSLGRDLRPIPRRRRAAVRRSELRPVSRLRRCAADCASVNYRLARYGVLGTCHRAGFGVMIWTVDSADLIDRYLTDPRIDVLITNRPQYAAARRAALS